MSANDLDVDAFIHEIFIRPPIWDGSYGNKDYLWLDISANFGYMSVDTLKKRWENLRRSFRRQLKKIPRSVDNYYLIDPHDIPSAWPYYQSMLFLVGRVRLGYQNQSLPVKNEPTPQNVNRAPTPLNVNRAPTPQNVNRAPTPQNVKQEPTPRYVKREPSPATKVSRKRPSANAWDGSDQPSKTTRNEDAETSNVGSSTRSSVTVDDHDNAALTKTVSSTAIELNWGDSHLIGASDRYYLKSLLPYLDKLDTVRKLVVRSKIDEILRDEISKL